jgi:hypothetical protein
VKAVTRAFTVCAVFAALVPVHAAAGNAYPLTDAELDAASAQGLVVVNTSFGFSRLAEHFDFRFTAQTTIETADVAGGGAAGHAEVAFLGGLLSISTTPRSRSAMDMATTGAELQALPLGGRPAIEGAVVSVTARQATVHTQATLFLSPSDAARSASRAALMRHIPRAFAGR